MHRTVDRPGRRLLAYSAIVSLCAGIWPALGSAQSFRFDYSRGDPTPTPTEFRVPATDGNYRVTLTLRGAQPGTITRILGEQRRLLAEDSGSRAQADTTRVVIVNVRTPQLDPLPANATGGTAVALKPREIGARNWDEWLTVDIEADPARIRMLEIEPVDVPVLYLAGDSTVTDQPVKPNASWGQMLPRFFRPDIAVANHAESGETLKSFVTEHRLDKLLSKLRPGDWVMIQFGHNDQKVKWPQTYAEAATTYRSWLRTYIAEVRRRGATPILVTSPERRNFDDAGKIVLSLGDYPDAMRRVASDELVELIDLNAMSRTFYEALGPQLAARAFADEGRDRTHFNEYGAQALARCIVEGIRTAHPTLTAGLATHLAADAGRFDPAHPQPPTP